MNVQCTLNFEYKKFTYIPDLCTIQYIYIVRAPRSLARCVEYKTVCRLNSRRQGVYANYITVVVVKDGARVGSGRDVEFPKGRSTRELVDRSKCTNL